ncbi:enoyl-CoA hydratase/isomerase family protein [Azospirillum doebereinerae]
MAAEYSTIRVVTDDNIGVIHLNRPDALNAINSVMVAEVTRALRGFTDDRAIRAIVLAGDGRAFSAGFDLKESAEKNYETPGEWRTVIEADFDFIMQFWDCRKPTIAAVHGFCLAGGMEMALSCDMVVGAENTLFGEPEVRFGAGVVALLIPWMVGPKLAKEILLTGNDRIPASRAVAMGLINEMVPDGQQLQRAMELARTVASAGPLAVEMTKRAINRSFDIRGMRESLLAGVDTDIFIESCAGPERAEFGRVRKEQGLKAAIAWRDARFRQQ